jgi:hypothetical protein
MTPVARQHADERVSSFFFLFFLISSTCFSPSVWALLLSYPLSKEKTHKKKETFYLYTGQHGNSSIVKGRSLEGLGKTKNLGKFLFFSFLFSFSGQGN